jgi:MraZ protein
VTRKSQYGWMVMGGILCLCGGVVALKLREGNPAVAQAEPPRPMADVAAEPPPPPLSILKDSHDEPPLVEMKPLEDPARVLPPIAGVDASSKEPTIPTADLTPPPLPAPPLPVPSEPPLFPAPAPPAAAAVVSAPPSVVEPPVKSEPKTADKTPEPLPAPPGSIEPPLPSLGAASPQWNEPTAPKPTTRPEAPKAAAPAVVVQVSQVGEPPLAGMGPIQSYQVRTAGETMRDIARRTLGAGERWTDVYKLNPSIHPEDSLTAGTVVHLPSDACMPADELAGLKPLPAMRPKTATTKPKAVMALTGTYPCNIDDKRGITLPRAVRDQFGDAEVVLVSPGPDQCLWLTDPAHQERLAERLEHSPAREVDVRVFKRLYYAQTEKTPVGADGRVAVSDRLTAFAGLSQEVVLVGIDDHFEIWDAARWKQYTQLKSVVAPGSE